MNFNNLLNQVLGTVQKTGSSVGKNSDLIAKIGGGAAVAGLASMFLKKKNTKKIVTAGSMAALGALAYHAYQNWQRNNNNNGGTQQTVLDQAAFEPSGQAAENAGRIILRTMIAAAAADGLIEDEERRLIQAETGNDPETVQWVDNEVQRPALPADIAREIGGNQALAAEAYLAARLVCGDLARKEIVFLSQLSQALNLDDKLVEALEKQAGF
ncbi:tellurite resistance TerB family protein [Neisseria dentiae]|uniref:tellurite resistance TerB family protein n=1 Tax=Neisseria dentiae TaxID=194197 RepID=UPI0035A090BC